jgi:glycosyltransferase involved in cell wall biosynthesis
LGLETRGHRSQALVANDALAQGFRARGVEALTLPVAHTRLRGARALRKALRASGTDVLLADTARDVRLAALASLGMRTPIVYCISTPDPQRDPLTRILFRQVRLTVFLSDGLARRALAAAPFMRRAAQRVIPNGVDCTFFRPDPAAGQVFRSRYGLGTGALLLGVGALAPEKRWDLLLESLAKLPRPAPPLLLCGVGALEGALRAHADRLHLDVRFVGQIESGELVEAYNAATCVVHARPDEVFALVLIEALACGRPVVAAGGGGTPDVLGDAGVLASPGDTAAFAQELARLLADEPRRTALSRAARERAVARFSLERMVTDYGELVESLA